MQPTKLTPKLPIIGSAVETWSLIFRNMGFLIRVGAVWILLTVALLTGVEWAFQRLGFQVSFVIGSVNSMIFAGCLSAVAVRWHRHILQRATRTALTTRLVFSYALAAFGLDASWQLFSFLPVELVPWTELSVSAWFAGILGFLALFIVSAYIWGRLSLLLPAIALGGDGSPRTAWTASSGNGWRLFFGSLLAMLPAIAASLALMFGTTIFGLVYEDVSKETDAAAITTLVSDLAEKFAANLCLVGLALLAISFLSIAYRELVLKRVPSNQSQPAG
jgi:hypothetical protein